MAGEGGKGVQASRQVCPSGNIVQDERGAYCWVYEFNLWTNPAILFTVLKVLVIVVAADAVLMLLLLVPDLFGGTLHPWQVEGAFQGIAIMLAIVVGLGLVGYAVYAAMMGGAYCVAFTMNERGVEHRQLPRQFKKAQAVAALNVLAGVASGSPSQAGIGILAASRNSLASDFEAVKSIKGSRTLQVVKVGELFAKNQVYVEPEDYDFVFDYIVSHCPNAKKVTG